MFSLFTYVDAHLVRGRLGLVQGEWTSTEVGRRVSILTKIACEMRELGVVIGDSCTGDRVRFLKSWVVPSGS